MAHAASTACSRSYTTVSAVRRTLLTLMLGMGIDVALTLMLLQFSMRISTASVFCVCLCAGGARWADRRMCYARCDRAGGGHALSPCRAHPARVLGGGAGAHRGGDAGACAISISLCCVAVLTIVLCAPASISSRTTSVRRLALSKIENDARDSSPGVADLWKLLCLKSFPVLAQEHADSADGAGSWREIYSVSGSSASPHAHPCACVARAS